MIGAKSEVGKPSKKVQLLLEIMEFKLVNRLVPKSPFKMEFQLKPKLKNTYTLTVRKILRRQLQLMAKVRRQAIT